MKAIKVTGAVEQQRQLLLNSRSSTRRRRPGLRWLTGRLMGAGLAIAVSGLLITSAFAQDDPIEATPIVLDKPPVAMVMTAPDAELEGNNALKAQVEAGGHLLQSGFEPAWPESRVALLQRAAKAFGIVLIALVGHWLTGRVWRRSLRNLMRRITFYQDAPQAQLPTALNLFLNLTLALMRLCLWGGAAIYITNLFPLTRQLSDNLIKALSTTLFGRNFYLGQQQFSILDLLLLLGLLLGLVIGAGTLTNLLRSRVLQITRINRGAQEAVAILTKYSLISIGAIVILQVWGLDLSSLTLLASALGIGIGLGLQNIAKDFSSGLVLVFERSIQVGEFIEFGQFMGTVERIGARSTEIRTLDQVSIIVPNSRFLEQEVINWSHRNPISRIRLPVGVDYQSDPEMVKQALLEATQTDGDILSTPAPQVLFSRFGDSALEFELLVWINEPGKQPVIKSNLNFAIEASLRKHNIEIPFPQRDVNLAAGNLPIELSGETIEVLTKLLKASR